MVDQPRLVWKCRRPCGDGFATEFMEAKEGHDLTYSNNAYGVTEEGLAAQKKNAESIKQ
jgi:hypothetical protein